MTLHKLWPWPPWDGRSLRPASSPNEGVTDNYYGLDLAGGCRCRIGAAKAELPMVLWLVPTAALIALALAPDRGRGRDLRAEARPALVPVACLALGALATPVAITTASAFEAESFVVTHHLALGLLVGTLIRARRRPPVLSAGDGR